MSDDYTFDPQPDITAYELAQLLTRLKMRVTPDTYESMSADMRRHFSQGSQQ